jgi:hypothetical protein
MERESVWKIPAVIDRRYRLSQFFDRLRMTAFFVKPTSYSFTNTVSGTAPRSKAEIVVRVVWAILARAS